MTAVGDGMQHDIVTRLRELPTAAISDALDQAEIEGALHGIVPLSNHFRAVDPAFGIMTEIAAVRGIAGTVINGVCRDVSACLAQNYPLFSRGCFMRTGKDRVRLEAVGVPVTVSAIQIHPGTFICADADGVVAVPADAGRIIETAERVERIESDIVAAARTGSTLREARETFGYHTLQTRES